MLVGAGARAELLAVREHADKRPLERVREGLGDALQPRLDLERAAGAVDDEAAGGAARDPR